MINNVSSSTSFKGISVIEKVASKTSRSVIQEKLTQDSIIWKVANALYIPKKNTLTEVSDADSTKLLTVINAVIGKNITMPINTKKWIAFTDEKHIIFGTIPPGKTFDSVDNGLLLKLDIDA